MKKMTPIFPKIRTQTNRLNAYYFELSIGTILRKKDDSGVWKIWRFIFDVSIRSGIQQHLEVQKAFEQFISVAYMKLMMTDVNSDDGKIFKVDKDQRDEVTRIKNDLLR